MPTTGFQNSLQFLFYPSPFPFPFPVRSDLRLKGVGRGQHDFPSPTLHHRLHHRRVRKPPFAFHSAVPCKPKNSGARARAHALRARSDGTLQWLKWFHLPRLPRCRRRFVCRRFRCEESPMRDDLYFFALTHLESRLLRRRKERESVGKNDPRRT